jgi:hypothetical protein
MVFYQNTKFILRFTIKIKERKDFFQDLEWDYE